jgi:hypothetical protein
MLIHYTKNESLQTIIKYQNTDLWKVKILCDSNILSVLSNFIAFSFHLVFVSKD